jgi:outer membrane protein assembly factor BamB
MNVLRRRIETMNIAILIVIGLACLVGLIACIYGVFARTRHRKLYIFLDIVFLAGGLLSGMSIMSKASIPHQPAPVPANVQLLVQNTNSSVSTVSSINGRDGSAGWHYNLDADVFTYRWTLSGNILYLVQSRHNGTVTLVALHVNDGKQLWNTVLPASTTNNIFAPALVADGMVYVPVSEQLFVLHANNGMLAWQTSLHNLYIYNSGASQPLAAGDGYLFLGTRDGVFHALRAQDGKQVWNINVGKDLGFPTLADGQIYLSPDRGHGIVALRAQDGTILWHFQLPVDQIPNYPLSVGPGHVYLSTADGSGHEAIDTLNAQDGKLLWQHATAHAYEEPHEVEGIVYVSLPSMLLALRANDGKQLWQYQLQHTSEIDAAVSFIGGTHKVIFILTENDTHSNDLGTFPCLWSCPPQGITALNASNGNPYGQYEGNFWEGLLADAS